MHDKQKTLELAQQILTDLENGTVAIEFIVSKALRLAQLTGDLKAIEWLTFEIYGYRLETEVGTTYSQLMGRWDGKATEGTFGSAASLSTVVKSVQSLADAQREYKPTGTYAHAHHVDRMQQLKAYINQIAPLEKILSTLRAQLHLFASKVLNETQFSETSRSIFENYQEQTDAALAKTASEAFSKLPQVFERLDRGEQEAISHALTSCRRIIDAFADVVFPPQSELVQIKDQALDCKQGKTKNQIRAYIAQTVSSEGRADRLNKNLNLLYNRVSAGVHSDVPLDEAKALTLNTYLLLGELLSLKK